MVNANGKSQMDEKPFVLCLCHSFRPLYEPRTQKWGSRYELESAPLTVNYQLLTLN